jgi:archaellum component FlaC
MQLYGFYLRRGMMSQENLERIVKLLETISEAINNVGAYDIGRELNPVLEELGEIREELERIRKDISKIQYSAEKIEEKYRWSGVRR